MTNQDIRKLVEKYEADRNMYLTDRYNETLVRSDFLDPLFELLGWDIKNKAGRPTNEREVILEEPLKAGASENTKKPDYTFRLFAERKFFLEAKKPCVSIDKVDGPARQARRYGYTANLKISEGCWLRTPWRRCCGRRGTSCSTFQMPGVTGQRGVWKSIFCWIPRVSDGGTTFVRWK